MSKTIEEIKEQYAKDFERASFEDMLWSYAESENGINNFIMITDEVAERYAQSQTQELQEQNAELVEMLRHVVYEYKQGEKSYSTIREINELLTKHNNLNKKP